MTEAFPLKWPDGWKGSTEDGGIQKRAPFKVTMAKARDHLLDQIRLLGGELPVISSNVPIRQDGLPYARYSEPDDPGVAVYFQLGGRPMVFACDRFDLVQDNMRAIGLSIEALRGLERWGASDMMERAFSGFEALPPPSDPKHWSLVLDIPASASEEQIKAAYRKRARSAHPDHGGSDSAMAELNQARDDALRARAA